jgi:type IV conjugative transfer system coupling protein TraD
MTDDYQTSMRNFIRGGQVMLHNYRMIKQLFDRALIFALAVFLIVTVGISYYRFNGWHRFAAMHWCTANVFTFFDGSSKQKMIFPGRYSGANEIKIVFSRDVLRDPEIKGAMKEIGSIITQSVLYGAISGITSLVLIFVFLRRRGRSQSETKKLRGYGIEDIKHIKKLVKKGEGSDIKIGGVPMPKDFECGHILIHGTTGMGKSVCIKELLDQIRARGDKAIIYDQGCDYISSFYNEDDVILNPLDDRTASWNLWNECRDSADYDSLAAALIPSAENNSEPFWSNGAKIIFAAMARKLKANIANPTIQQLLEAILVEDLSKMEMVLGNTEAASLVSGKVEKTALSFKATLAIYLKSLRYVKDEKNPFSIRSWIQDDNQKNWLFISSLADRHETLKPLISMWLDLAANALMSLTPSHTRRIWLIFDELASLHKLPYLPNAFAQSRKFGGCLVAGIQSISQLRKVYGHHAADEISTMCNTRIFFRSPSNEAAVWTSKELGQHEIEEMQEGISYSESAMRSGISINKQIMQKDLVSPAEIMRLHSLEAYMRLPGALPIIKVKLKYKERKNDTVAFIPRELVEKDFDFSNTATDDNKEAKTESRDKEGDK